MFAWSVSTKHCIPSRKANRTSQVEERIKDARGNPSSKYPVAKLSPNSHSVKMNRENKILRTNVKVCQVLDQAPNEVIRGTANRGSLRRDYTGVTHSLSSLPQNDSMPRNVKIKEKGSLFAVSL